MIKIWFLMALMSYPNIPAIAYKGFGGFLTQEECEEGRVTAENTIVEYEMQKERTVHIETYCVEMEAFKSQLEKKKESNNTGLGV